MKRKSGSGAQDEYPDSVTVEYEVTEESTTEMTGMEWSNFSRIVPFLGAGPGDINGDAHLSITDVTTLINMLLRAD